MIGAVLSAMDLPTPLVDALLQCDPAWVNRRIRWQNVELCRVLNGSRAHRAGLPQDELFHARGEFRRCLRFFDTAHQLALLAPPLRETLADAIVGYPTECIVDSAIVPRDVRHRLQDAHGGPFVNRIDGRVFADESTVRVTCTSVAWSEFGEAHRSIIDAALAQFGTEYVRRLRWAWRGPSFMGETGLEPVTPPCRGGSSPTTEVS